MKLLKKSSLVALALILCTSSIASTNAEATGNTYLQGDIDGDGSVTLSDLGYLTNFLHGYKATANDHMTQRLDVDLSGIIDQNDITLLSDIVIGNETSDSIDYISTNSGIPGQESIISYRKHNAQTGIKIGNNYDLNQLSEIQNQESRDIIGTDDREINQNKSGIVKLTFYMNDGWHYGSGFIVDDHTILTAAHCLYDSETGSYASNIYYTTYSSGENTYSIATASTYHLPQKYVDSPALAYDYGMIIVNNDFSDENSEYEIYNLGVARDVLKNNISSSIYTNINNKLEIYVSGFSGEETSNSDPSLTGHMVTGSGNLLCNWIAWDGELYYNTDTVRVESGGPVYVKTPNGDVSVIGINTEGSASNNRGKRIDTDILHFVYNNPYI